MKLMHAVFEYYTFFLSRINNNQYGRPSVMKSTGYPEENAQCLIWCKLKMTVFLRSAFLFSKSSYFNLKFEIKQSKIGGEFAEEWLPKAKIVGPADEQTTRFCSKNALI